MSVNLSLLAERIRAEVVGRGQVPKPVFDESATGTVRIAFTGDAADTYLARRLRSVLDHLQAIRPSARPGPATPDVALDALVALGEYETYLQLRAVKS